MENNGNFMKPNEDLRNLQLLEEISRDSTASQRKLSERLGVALGVTNACLKKMANKGYIKVKGINHKRISYFLTPEGFSEKTRLTYHFLEYTVHYYINLKKNLSEKLGFISKQGVKRAVFYGAGDVMEVAFVTSSEAEARRRSFRHAGHSKTGVFRPGCFCAESYRLDKAAGHSLM